jgi:hypothetical protein
VSVLRGQEERLEVAWQQERGVGLEGSGLSRDRLWWCRPSSMVDARCSGRPLFGSQMSEGWCMGWLVQYLCEFLNRETNG